MVNIFGFLHLNKELQKPNVISMFVLKMEMICKLRVTSKSKHLLLMINDQKGPIIFKYFLM